MESYDYCNLLKITRSRLLVFALTALTPLTSHSGSLLGHIDALNNSGYIVTATMSFYDTNNDLIDRQSARAESLFGSAINTGTTILFGGSLSFPTPFPFMPGGSGGAPITLHDFEVDLSTLNAYIDRVHVQMDWFAGTDSFTQDWSETVGDDFVNGIAYYFYGQSYYPGPEGELISYGYYADLQMTFASGIAPVPVPAAVWSFGFGIMALIAVGRRSKAA
ncbi:MAG: hypothetical protein HY941_00135 [Gammaproteobacteria bacterium]|nr:hypothetical protein [Gammaproteobacteria bacterium]